jgi:hypothetical protein
MAVVELKLSCTFHTLKVLLTYFIYFQIPNSYIYTCIPASFSHSVRSQQKMADDEATLGWYQVHSDGGAGGAAVLRLRPFFGTVGAVQPRP